ncbi:putative wall-associated receptor kinase-like 16 [Typha angustifolia]|uniref:putative wall-associated receptor kinase-like 16 n=1 Tax=Typha angustifolia TaxID=59011 RepID=UPI003C2BDBE9
MIMEPPNTSRNTIKKLSRHILYVILFLLHFLLLSRGAASAGAVALPGCQDTCGDVQIPYPFGIGNGCFMEGFEVTCNQTTHSPIVHNIEVLNISLSAGQARLNNQISWQCYIKENSTTSYTHWSWNLSMTPYRFSDTLNKFTAVGCETLVYIGNTTEVNSYDSGCVSMCNTPQSLVNGSCAGIGCCQTAIPKGISYYRVMFDKNWNSSNVWNFSPCSYAVLAEAAGFEFKSSYITTPELHDKHVPVVVDWAIGTETCEIAKLNMTSYACLSENSRCINSINGPGYLCNCSEGYRGNPYLQGGCQDIDECADKDNYPCSGICNNTPGNFSCSCPPGEYGDPSLNGKCYPKQKSSLAVPVVVAISVGIVVPVLLVFCLYVVRERRKLEQVKEEYFRQHGGWLLYEEIRSKQRLAFKIFTKEELEEATNKFADDTILGRGGYGTVYKGTLKDNSIVAIKRSKVINDSQTKEFVKEMLILSQINHKNVVKLLGCCLEVEVPMLVYEFVPNGTLFQLIHDNTSHVSLKTRLRIAQESAEALSYLHLSASPPIIHGDVKTSNILLDENYKTKVSDFGASMLAPMDETQFVTMVQGTCGYLDPEYLQTSVLTDKSDVYSFGVVLLELLTGKKAFSFAAPEEERSLSSNFISAMKADRLHELLDDQIITAEDMELIKEFANLAKACLSISGEERPTMKEVAEELDKLRKLKQHPWAQHNPAEVESLLGESSNYPENVTTGHYNLEKEAVHNIQSGR